MNTGMECSCLVDTNDGFAADVFSEKIHRAEKSYTCCECNETISPGEKYEYVWGIWEGEPFTFRTCIICARIRKDYCCSWIYSNLREELWNALGVDYVTGKIREEDE